MTATTNEDSIQALSYCAKNPSQKLPAEQAKSYENNKENKILVIILI